MQLQGEENLRQLELLADEHEQFKLQTEHSLQQVLMDKQVEQEKNTHLER